MKGRQDAAQRHVRPREAKQSERMRAHRRLPRRARTNFLFRDMAPPPSMERERDQKAPLEGRQERTRGAGSELRLLLLLPLLLHICICFALALRPEDNYAAPAGFLWGRLVVDAAAGFARRWGEGAASRHLAARPSPAVLDGRTWSCLPLLGPPSGGHTSGAGPCCVRPLRHAERRAIPLLCLPPLCVALPGCVLSGRRPRACCGAAAYPCAVGLPYRWPNLPLAIFAAGHLCRWLRMGAFRRGDAPAPPAGCSLQGLSGPARFCSAAASGLIARR
jgi:hypothetical protein